MDNDKSQRLASAPRVNPTNIRLQPGRGSKSSGGGVGGHYWHVYAGGVRAGRVFINIIDQPPLGRHPSLQIYLNRPYQGLGIGSTAYRLACEASGYQEVYAHMRKSNIASRRAAENAGFEAIDRAEIRQLSLVWRRP